MTAYPSATMLLTSIALKFGTMKTSIDIIGITMSRGSWPARPRPSALFRSSGCRPEPTGNTERPPPRTASRVKSTRKVKAIWPAMKKAIVAGRGRPPAALRNVPAKTPMAAVDHGLEPDAEEAVSSCS